MCGWDAPTKLVTRLWGQTFRSCNSDQRSNYDVLVGELLNRFIPVRIQAVQSSLFRERKQGLGESIDDYVQDLRQLFSHVYPNSQQGTSEAETMGQ